MSIWHYATLFKALALFWGLLCLNTAHKKISGYFNKVEKEKNIEEPEGSVPEQITV